MTERLRLLNILDIHIPSLERDTYKTVSMQQVLQISSQPAEVLFVLLKVTLFLVSPWINTTCFLGGWLLTSLLQGLIYIPIRIVYNIYFHPLSLYPGPTSCAATRFPYFRALLGGCLVKRVAEWHEAYGPVVRIAPDELSYTSAAAWKDIYGYCRNTMQNHKDTRFYSSPISDPADFDVSKKVDQSRYRSSLVQAFSGASLRQQEPIVKGYVDKLIGRLHQLTETETNPVDMVSWYSFATFDIIRDLAFGESFDCLENAQYHEWISMVFNKIRLGVYLNVIKRVPGGEWLLRFPLPKSFVPSQFRQQILTAEKVESHLSVSNDKPTFLGHLLQQEDSSKKLTTPEILWNASAFILAGSETTATAICGITYYLLREPACLEKLVQEVRGSFNSKEEITFSSVSKLKYLLAVVNEGLRMYPPVPIGLPRIVPEGTVIDGKWVPRRVGSNPPILNFWKMGHSIDSRADCSCGCPDVGQSLPCEFRSSR